jgi:hypothetical protein
VPFDAEVRRFTERRIAVWRVVQLAALRLRFTRGSLPGLFADQCAARPDQNPRWPFVSAKSLPRSATRRREKLLMLVYVPPRAHHCASGENFVAEVEGAEQSAFHFI